jgi:hypothetical protein
MFPLVFYLLQELLEALLAAAHLERHSVDGADIPIAFAKLIDNNRVHDMKEVQ